MTDRPKVLYIAGWSRSGTTLLDRVLGQAEHWFSCGELRLLWNNFLCGCGTPVLECELWEPILRETFGEHPDLDPRAVFELRQRHLGSAWTLSTLARVIRSARNRRSPLRRYAALLADLYAAIARATGARVLVDSSKTASDAYLIAALTDIDVYVAHVVRDPRGSAYSLLRNKRFDLPDRPAAGELPTMSPIRSSVNWLRTHAAIERVVRPTLEGRYVRTRYEDFTRHPQAAAEELRTLVGEPDAELLFSAGTTVTLSRNHTVGGNPIRFSHGQLTIRPDEAWRANMDARSRALATIPALPLMPRYGYPVIGSGRDPVP